MKKLLTKITAFLFAVFALTSCVSLLPKAQSRASDNNPTNGTQLTSDSPDSADEYYLWCSDETAVCSSGYTTFLQFAIRRYSDDSALELNSNCRIDTLNYYLAVTSSGFNTPYTFYAEMVGDISGRYQYDVQLNSYDGVSLAKMFSICVNENTKDSAYYVDYDCFRTFENTSFNNITFNVHNTAEDYLCKFSDMPSFDVDSTNAFHLSLVGSRLDNDKLTLNIEICADSIGQGELYIKLILENGETINTTIFYNVVPFYQFVTDQELTPLVPGNKTTIIYNFVEHTLQGDVGASMKENTFKYEYNLNSLTVDVADISPNSVILEITYESSMDDGYITLSVISTDGYRVETRFMLFTDSYSPNQCYINSVMSQNIKNIQ